MYLMNKHVLAKWTVIYWYLIEPEISEEANLISVKCGSEVTAALCPQCFFWLPLLWESSFLRPVWSWQLCTDKWAYTPGGQRQPNPPWMRSVCAVSFGSQRGLSSSVPPLPPGPLPGPLCADTAPCGLPALRPFTCDCVQSPCSHPPLNPESPSPASSWPLTAKSPTHQVILVYYCLLKVLKQVWKKLPVWWSCVNLSPDQLLYNRVLVFLILMY